MEEDKPLGLGEVSKRRKKKKKSCHECGGDPSLVEKQKEKRKTYFTYWNAHDLENWELQSQPTITNDEMEELEELEQLIVMEKEELDRKK